MGIILLVGAIFLAYFNGANDNFKGVATVLGSGTAGYRRTLAWATVCTLAGSITAFFLASELLTNFSGKGLIDASLVRRIGFASAVAFGASLTVCFATRFGMPVSTTHALLGALIGAGISAGSSISLDKLGTSFLWPLLLSPLIAAGLTVLVYPVMRIARTRAGIGTETCLCIGNQVVETVCANDSSVSLSQAKQLSVTMGETVHCRQLYQGAIVGIDAQSMLNGLHFATSGVVSFARGLNDTPKIAALLLVGTALPGHYGIGIIGVAIAIGGLVSGRRVARTMSREITAMNHGQGLVANALTGLVVIGASRLGLPVSTTHVSCGALFGIGAINKQAHWKMIGRIIASWLLTLPFGGLMGAVAWECLRRIDT